jgi:hypothetical protein
MSAKNVKPDRRPHFVALRIHLRKLAEKFERFYDLNQTRVSALFAEARKAACVEPIKIGLGAAGQP